MSSLRPKSFYYLQKLRAYWADRQNFTRRLAHVYFCDFLYISCSVVVGGIGLLWCEQKGEGVW